MSYMKIKNWKPEEAFTERNNSYRKELVSDVQKYPFCDFPERNLSKETCETFGVRASLSEEDGVTPTAYYFPSYNQKGKIVGYMKMNLEKDKYEAGHWTAVGVVSIGNKLFGQDVAESVQRKRKNVIITEGQIDAMSVYQTIVNGVKGTKFEFLKPFVVSIPLGTANAKEALLHNEEFVSSFESMSIFFDNDECTPAEKVKNILRGKEATDDVATAFIGTGIDIFTLQAEPPYKDASDYLQDDNADALNHLILSNKHKYSPEKIIHLADVPLDDILKKKKEGAMVKEFPKLMNSIRGLRTGELITLCAPSGVGKSTITSIMAEDMADAGFKVGCLFLEETKEETTLRFIAKRLHVNYTNFKDDPEAFASKDKIEEVYNELSKEDRIIIVDHFGSLNANDLMNKIRYLHLVEGCDFIFIDHAGMLTASADIVDERRTLDIVITTLAAFCAANPCGIVLVSHINRTAAEQFRPPKLKEGEEQKPYWVQVSKEMMRSSAALEQLSWIVLGVEPMIMPDRSRGPIRIVVLKNRTFGTTGVADTFTLDYDTWDVLPVKEEYF